MSKFIKSNHSLHTLYVETCTVNDLPAGAENTENYTTFYRVRNACKDGCVFFYLGKGHALAPKQIVGWYGNGKFWSSYGNNLQQACDGMQRDGWLYTK